MTAKTIHNLALSLLVAVALPVAATAQTSGKAASEASAAKNDAAAKAGPAQTCIDLARIDHSEIKDDSTILFHMKGGQIYENKLPYRCFGLKFEDGFAYSTSLSQLCNTDIIHVLHRGTACGLGMFTPYVKPAKDEKGAKKDDYWAKPKK
jgi:hypothetical protein